MNQFPIDDATADRLLSGALSPEDSPPGYAGVAGVFRAAAGPGTPDELASQSLVVAAAAAEVLSAPTIRPTTRRKPMLSKLLSVQAAGVAAAALLGAAGVAAAATGNLPSSAQSAVSSALSHVDLSIPKPSSQGTTNGNNASTTSAKTSSGKTDQDKTGTQKPADKGANAKADFGQCTAFLAGSATGRSHKDHSSAFTDLMADHGGMAKTTAFCKAVVAEHESDTASTTEQPAEPGKPADTGKPSSPGNSGSHADVPAPTTGSSNAGSQGGGASHHP